MEEMIVYLVAVAALLLAAVSSPWMETGVATAMCIYGTKKQNGKHSKN
jgi:hypothetical protein